MDTLQEHRDDPALTYAEQRMAAFDERIDVAVAAVARGCRHCGQPVELGLDGALLHARLGLDDTTTLPYAAHLTCQVEVLDQLAAASHEAISRWRVTATGVAVLAQERSNEGT